jgi:3-methylcrotonyl-CoA carboxylase alpha subunit
MAATATLSSPGHAEVRLAGHERPVTVPLDEARVARWPGHLTLFSEAGTFAFLVSDPFERADPAASADAIRAPMPGLVKLVRVQKGDAVVKAQPLLVLEAMKMEHAIAAPHDAVVSEIVAEGRQVSDGDVLVRFEPAAAKAASG